jgi:Ca2+-binding EF-hand superfamily protein
MENTFGVDHDTAAENVQKIFAECGKTHEQALDFNEYVVATSLMSSKICEKTLCKIFDELDTNKDRVISLEELGRSIGGVNLRSLLQEAGKEELTFSDFKAIMM